MVTINYSFIRAICALIIGLILVLVPNVAVNYIIITIGILFLIPGVISTIGYFTRKREPGITYRFPLEGVGSLLFGLWLIISPTFFANVLMYLLGFILIVGGVQQILSLIVARRWTAVSWYFYIVPLLILIAGIVVIFDPTSSRETILMIIGIACLVYAVSELVNWFRFGSRKPNRLLTEDIENIRID